MTCLALYVLPKSFAQSATDFAGCLQPEVGSRLLNCLRRRTLGRCACTPIGDSAQALISLSTSRHISWTQDRISTAPTTPDPPYLAAHAPAHLRFKRMGAFYLYSVHHMMSESAR